MAPDTLHGELTITSRQRADVAQPFHSKPLKKSLTAETAETAEKKTSRILGVLCALGGKRRFFTRRSVTERGANTASRE